MQLSGRRCGSCATNGFAMSRPIMPGKCVMIACALTDYRTHGAARAAGILYCRRAERRRQDNDTAHDLDRGSRDKSGRSGMVAERRGTTQGAVRLSRRPGLPFLMWDNIPLGAAIGCPAIERALTTEVYSDRVLGVSEYREVPAYTVQTFTGNNISPRGDLASRSLTARITVDRPDPENRKFTHADPIAWTEQNRADILSALYTILLGNPRFKNMKANKPAETRFKAWWHLSAPP